MRKSPTGYLQYYINMIIVNTKHSNQLYLFKQPTVIRKKRKKHGFSIFNFQFDKHLSIIITTVGIAATIKRNG